MDKMYPLRGSAFWLDHEWLYDGHSWMSAAVAVTYVRSSDFLLLFRLPLSPIFILFPDVDSSVRVPCSVYAGYHKLLSPDSITQSTSLARNLVVDFVSAVIDKHRRNRHRLNIGDDS